MCLAVLWKYPINGKVIKENNKSPKKVNFNNDLVQFIEDSKSKEEEEVKDHLQFKNEDINNF